MEYLPCEMIEHIFSFLAYKEHLRATEVCHRWKDIFETRVVQNTMVKIAYKDFTNDRLSFQNSLHKLVMSTRMYRNLTIEGVDYEYLERRTEIQLSILLANMGLYILDLTLKNCLLTTEKLFLIVSLLKHAKTIHFDNCQIYEAFVPELKPRLASIQLVRISNVMAEHASLIALLTSGNSANIHVTMNKDYIDQRTDFIREHAKNLKELFCSFSETRTLERIFACPGLNLESLTLHRNPAYELMHITYLDTIATQGNLTKLSINMPISLRVLAAIARNLPLLEFLEVIITETRDDELFTTDWAKLKVLALSHSKDMNSLLNGMNIPNLEELQLYTNKLSRRTMETIYQKCSGLKKLALAALSMVRCENILGSIGDRLPGLVEIGIQCSSRTTFIPFFASVQTINQLDTLSICYCDQITDETLMQIQLPYIRTLRITRNVKISRTGLENLFNNCPRIVSLTIRQCPLIDDEAVRIAATSLPNLEFLDISESPIITLNSIRYIMENCRFLKDLRIEECRRLLILWRNAPYYIDDINALRSYYNAYPEFFYYHLPPEPLEEYDSDYCFYNDSEADISDIDDIVDYIEPEIPNSPEQNNEEVDHVIVLSDDE